MKNYFADIKLVALDLDGTILNNKKKIGKKDYALLQQLKQQGILVVVATGRNPESVRRVLSTSAPVDYLIFSNGAGICSWPSLQLVRFECFTPNETAQIVSFLKTRDITFVAYKNFPHNEHYVYFREKKPVKDFWRRLSVYRRLADVPLPEKLIEQSSHFVCFLAQTDTRLPALREHFSTGYTTLEIRSPIDNRTLWFEILKVTAGKGNSLEFLGKKLNISPDNMLSLGNDVNDLSMLEYTKYSFAVENAVVALKSDFQLCRSNNHNPLTDACNQLSKGLKPWRK